MWFALLSGEEEAELNVCGLLPGATAATAAEPTSVIDAVSLPAIVFENGEVNGLLDELRGSNL